MGTHVSGFRGGKRERERLLKDEIFLQELTHTGIMGSGFKSLFYGRSLTQDTVQDVADSYTV